MTSYRDVVDTLENEEYLDEPRATEVRERLDQFLSRPEDSRLIAVVAGLGAWLAALFIVGFLLACGFSGELEEALLAYVLLFGSIAVGLDQFDELQGTFASQASLAFAAAAQCVVPVALANSPIPAMVATQFIVSGTLYALLPSRANRALSAVIGLGIISTIMASESFAGYVGVYGIALGCVGAVFGLGDQIPWKIRRLARPGAYVCAIIVLVMATEPIFLDIMDTRITEAVRPWIFRGAAALFALGVVALHAVDETDWNPPVVLISTGVILAIGSLTSSGVFVSLLIAGLGFWKLDRVLIVTGGLGLAGQLAVYYSQLELSLLDKSIMLVVTGLILLAARWWYARSHGEEDA